MGEYAEALRAKLRSLTRVQLVGEIVNLRAARARVYFELRDATGAVPCAAWLRNWETMLARAGEVQEAYAVALGSMFLIYIGMSWRSAVPPYYFLLHPVSTALFIYTLLRSMVLTLWNDGIEWRGTKYPLEELRKGMV